MKGNDTGWHIDDAVLAAYARSTLAPAAAWSVEAHLPGCDDCRRRIGPLANAGQLHRVRQQLIERTDRPRTRPLERMLGALGVREHTVRLLLATRGLRLSWLLAVAVVAAFAVAAAHGQAPGLTLIFLALAPVLPLAGVATAYGAGVDPTHEITVAAPMSGFRLLLVRAIAVLVATIPIVALVSVAMPGADVSTAAWLLPALALATTSLALSPLLGPIQATTAVAVGWAALVLATAVPSAGYALPFSAGGQVGSLLVGACAVAVLILQRHRFDSGDTGVTRRTR